MNAALRLGAVAAIYLGSTAAAQPSPDVVKLLTQYDQRVAKKPLAKLFHVGDDAVPQLVAALRHKDEKVRINAQLILRYLGNPDGMRALQQTYRDGITSIITGVVPVPLSEWDYEQIESKLLCKTCVPKDPFIGYIYALAIEDSATSQKLLKSLEEKLSGIQLLHAKPMPIKDPQGSSRPRSDDILKHAFFLSEGDRRASEVRFVARSGDNSKVLFEIYVNHGVLAEKWFHTVLVNNGREWRFLSVSLVAQS